MIIPGLLLRLDYKMTKGAWNNLKFTGDGHYDFRMRKTIAFLPLALGGCFFGTFQTPEPVGPGKVDAQISASFPGFVTPDAGRAASEENIYRSYNIGGSVGFGVSSFADLGVMMNGMGIGPYFKWRPYASSRKKTRVTSFAIQPYLLYDVLGGTYLLTPGVNLIFGNRPSKNWMWYLAWQGVYAPAYGDQIETKLWGNADGMPEGLYQHMSLGLDFKYKGSGEFVGIQGKTDYGFRLELGGSFFKYSGNNSYYPIFTLGLGFVGGSALGCLQLLGGIGGGM